MPYEKNGKFVPILIIAAPAASIAATVILGFYGIYFFFFFLPSDQFRPAMVDKEAVAQQDKKGVER